MSMFPDVRNDDFYNEDFLTKADKEFLCGADWMLEQITNLFENNLDTYAGRLEYDGDIDIDKVLDKAKDEISEMVKDWAEMERNMLVTSMIEGTEEDIYESNREDVLIKNEAAENPKEYYDTRKYAITGEKVFRRKNKAAMNEE